MVQPQAVGLRITLLGDFSIEYQGKPCLAINTARLQSLLAYLLLHRHAPQPRQQLAFLFWPDANETQAFTNLRNLLHKLRHALPNADCFLHTDAHNVQWLPTAPFVLDFAEFETVAAQAASESELTQAVALYGGDLLPNCYDDWIRPVRETAQQTFVTCLERLIDLLEQQRNYRAAIGYGQRLLQVDPLNEATVRRLMRLYAAADERASALRLYQQCVAALQRELEVLLHGRLLVSLLPRPATSSCFAPSRRGGRDSSHAGDDWRWGAHCGRRSRCVTGGGCSRCWMP